MAFQDYLRSPEIHSIQSTSYNGRRGDRICVMLSDSAPVRTVLVTIRKSDGRLIEHASMAQEETNRPIVYVAQKTFRRAQVVKIEAVATDLAGNTSSASALQPVVRPTSSQPTRRPRKIWSPEI